MHFSNDKKKREISQDWSMSWRIMNIKIYSKNNNNEMLHVNCNSRIKGFFFHRLFWLMLCSHWWWWWCLNIMAWAPQKQNNPYIGHQMLFIVPCFLWSAYNFTVSLCFAIFGRCLAIFWKRNCWHRKHSQINHRSYYYTKTDMSPPPFV